MALILLIFLLVSLLLGFRLYSSRILHLYLPPIPNRSVPARRYQDGMDFIPAPVPFLFGYQFKSISLDPILGPIIAIQFGWLPAVLWLLFGVIFAGWIQDYAVTLISIRSAGASLGTLAGDLLSSQSRIMLLSFIYLYLLLTMAALSVILSPLLARDTVPFGIFLLICTGLLTGQMIYRWRLPALPVLLITLLLALTSIYAGSNPIVGSITRSVRTMGGELFRQVLGSSDISGENFFWAIILLAISYIGAILPVWRFTQPVNFTASLVTFVTMGGAFIGLLVSTFTGQLDTRIQIPALVTTFQPHLGPLWPVLFVTISSGAVSGWHSLVSTYSTSRQIDKELDTLPVTAGASFLETCLAFLAIFFAMTLGVSSGRYAPDQGYLLVAGPAGVFVAGLQVFLNSLGLQPEAGATLGITLLVLIALAVLQLLLRINRMVAQELFRSQIPLVRKPALAAFPGLLVALLLIASGYWQNLWILFGGSNQALGGLALLVVSIWLARTGKPFLWTIIPGAFLLITGLAALFYVSLFNLFYQGVVLPYQQGSGILFGNILGATLGILFAAIALVLIIQSLGAIKRASALTRKKPS